MSDNRAASRTRGGIEGSGRGIAGFQVVNGL